jgi:hypothetical protein
VPPQNLFDPVMLLLIEALERHIAVTIVMADDLGDENGRPRSGLTDKQSATIFLRRDNAAGEQRATAAHELLHLICPELPEHTIESMAARLLVPDDFADADVLDVQAIADELCVDPQLVLTRIRDATAVEGARQVLEVHLGGDRYGTLQWDGGSDDGPQLVGKPLPRPSGRQMIMTGHTHIIDLATDRAHSARVYDYLLGGKTNYVADRAAGDAAIAAAPNARSICRNQRAFMHRAAAFAATELGLDQFLDIGTGIPTEPNLHQIVQAANPAARIVYVDNDPIVLAHAAALMGGSPTGHISYLQADARDPGEILASSAVADTLDLSRPVALSAIGLLHFLDDDEAVKLVRGMLAAVPSGSALLLSQSTVDYDHDGSVQRGMDNYRRAGIPNYARSHDEIASLFLAGLDVVEPGITSTGEWRPDGRLASPDRTQYAAVAVKP